jgi:ligand-binding SRPBCC domain-containing protein
MMEDLHFVRSSEMPAPVGALRDWHFRPGAFARLTPPWERARVIESPEPLRDGARAVIEVGLGPFRKRWVALHEVTEWGFVDRQAEGPFAKWEHRHRFEPIDETRSRLTDEIAYRLPFGWLGRLFGARLVERKLDRLFRYRHEATAADLGAGRPDSAAAASDA